MIAKLNFTIAKLRHEQFGQSAERGAILDQLEFELADREADAAQARVQAETGAPASAKVKVEASNGSGRRGVRCRSICRGERLVHPAPTTCPCCGGTALLKIGEDVTEMLEHVPSRWKVIQHCAREVLLPRLRDDRANASTVASDWARTRRPVPARPHPVLQIRANTVCICRSIARARLTPERVLILTPRRWPIGSAPHR